MLAGVQDAADGMPVLVSFVVDDKGDLLGDGLNIEAAVLYAEKHGASSVGVNCCSLAAANVAVPRMVASATTPVTVRPNVGDPVQTQDGPVWRENPEASRALASNGGMPVPQWWAVAVEPRRSPRRRWPRRSIYKGQNRSMRGGFFIACTSSVAFAK